MLTGKQRRYLRAQAHHLNPVVQIGKAGATGSVIEQVNIALTAHELVKVSILRNCEQDRHEVADLLTSGTKAELVQVLGKTVVLYRQSATNQQIILPS